MTKADTSPKPRQKLSKSAAFFYSSRLYSPYNIVIDKIISGKQPNCTKQVYHIGDFIVKIFCPLQNLSKLFIHIKFIFVHLGQTP
jgi:hypothetical protein